MRDLQPDEATASSDYDGRLRREPRCPAAARKAQTRRDHGHVIVNNMARETRRRATQHGAKLLLANMAAAYAIYHGPDGLQDIAKRCLGLAKAASSAFNKAGIQASEPAFDTIVVKCDSASVAEKARKRVSICGFSDPTR